MKTASKVLVIISLVTAAIYAFLSIIVLALLPMLPPIDTGDEYLDIFLVSFLTSFFRTLIATTILAIIFSIIALVKLSKPGKPPIGISVCTLIFCNIIAGILMLCIPEERPALVESTPSTDA